MRVDLERNPDGYWQVYLTNLKTNETIKVGGAFSSHAMAQGAQGVLVKTIPIIRELLARVQIEPMPPVDDVTEAVRAVEPAAMSTPEQVETLTEFTGEYESARPNWSMLAWMAPEFWRELEEAVDTHRAAKFRAAAEAEFAAAVGDGDGYGKESEAAQ